MKKKFLKFPEGFLWGASTSAHQVEGNNHNDWSEWEKENAERLAREAKNYWQPWQQEKFPEMFKSENYISGRAADHYNLYEKDFDLMKKLGVNAHRFSIEWSRIEPKEGKFDEKEIDHYRKVIAALRKRGIEPFVTLWHYTNPIWFQDKGGWMSRNAPEYFERFVRHVVGELKSVTYWVTLNEPVMYTFMNALGIGPWHDWPYRLNSLRAWLRMFRNLVLAHKKAYGELKAANPESIIGVTKSRVFFDAYKNRLGGQIVVFLANHFHNERFLKKIRHHQDFIGINHYTHNRIRVGFGNPRQWFTHSEKREVSDLNWEIYPESMYHVAEQAARYKKPIYITENGIADTDDNQREEYIKRYLQSLQKAIDKGADVRGYFYWSLLDNFEWSIGFWPRFGLIRVDYKTMERHIRGSALTYKKIAETNSI